MKRNRLGIIAAVGLIAIAEALGVGEDILVRARLREW